MIGVIGFYDSPRPDKQLEHVPFFYTSLTFASCINEPYERIQLATTADVRIRPWRESDVITGIAIVHAARYVAASYWRIVFLGTAGNHTLRVQHNLS